MELNLFDREESRLPANLGKCYFLLNNLWYPRQSDTREWWATALILIKRHPFARLRCSVPRLPSNVRGGSRGQSTWSRRQANNFHAHALWISLRVPLSSESSRAPASRCVTLLSFFSSQSRPHDRDLTSGFTIVSAHTECSSNTTDYEIIRS